MTKYSVYKDSHTWKNSLGDYGKGTCMGRIYKDEKIFYLEIFCEEINQKQYLIVLKEEAQKKHLSMNNPNDFKSKQKILKTFLTSTCPGASHEPVWPLGLARRIGIPAGAASPYG